jgi:hypothetical protein
VLRIIVELIPFGIEKNKKIMSELTVANTGEKTERGDYVYNYKGWVEHESTENDLLDERFQKETFDGKIHHDRRNSLYVLLYGVMRKALGSKDIKD